MTSKQSLAIGALLTRKGFRTWTYISVLTLLKERSYRSTDLGNLLSLSPAALTGITTSLEQQRLIRSVRSTKDRRVYNISITREGQEFLTQLQDACNA